MLLPYLLLFIRGRRSRLVVEPAEKYRPIEKLQASWMSETLTVGGRLSVQPGEVRAHGGLYKTTSASSAAKYSALFLSALHYGDVNLCYFPR